MNQDPKQLSNVELIEALLRAQDRLASEREYYLEAEGDSEASQDYHAAESQLAALKAEALSRMPVR